MTQPSSEPDPWQRRRVDPDAGGPEFGRLIAAFRRLQDVVVQIDMALDAVGRAADDVGKLAASLGKWQVDEWERCAGAGPDLPGRGHPLLGLAPVDDPRGA